MVGLKVRILSAVYALALLTIWGCTSYASKEDLQQLDERRAQVQSMRQKVTDLTNEKKKSEQEVQQKKQRLDQAKKEKEAVLKRLEEIEKSKQAQ
jgi:TolA-binding protein